MTSHALHRTPFPSMEAFPPLFMLSSAIQARLVTATMNSRSHAPLLTRCSRTAVMVVLPHYCWQWWGTWVHRMQ